MSIRLTEGEFADHADSSDGVCLACFEWTTGGVEPDAEGYQCEVCDALKVCGAEQALVLNLVLLFEEGAPE